MTREERALTHLRRHVPDAAKLLQIGSPGGECWVLDFALAFADAEAAAMRERAAVAADAIADIARTNGAEFVAAGASASAVAIRALSVTEETVDG